MEFTLVEKDAFEQMARDAGFHVVQIHGSYDRSPFEPARSPVMIWTLQRGSA